jgi:hypothetical protein
MWFGEGQLDRRSRRRRDGRVCVANVSRYRSQLRAFERQLKTFGWSIALSRSAGDFILVEGRLRRGAGKV